MKLSNEEINNLHVLLYSHKQQCFHSMTLINVMNDNINSILGYRRADSDWITISVAHSPDRFSEVMEALRSQLDGTMPKQPPLRVQA